VKKVLVSTIDEEFEDLEKGRGPDKKPRKKRGSKKFLDMDSHEFATKHLGMPPEKAKAYVRRGRLGSYGERLTQKLEEMDKKGEKGSDYNRLKKIGEL
jgi:hypothetical protein